MSVFNIPASLTEQISDLTTIKFTGFMNVSGLVANSSINFTVQPYRYTTIGNYSSSYTINSTLGQALYPAFYYPNCPAFKGPDAIPSSLGFSCYLYDSKSNLIT